MNTPVAPQGNTRLITSSFVALILSTFFYFVTQGAIIPVLPRFVAGPLRGSDVAVGLIVGAFGISAVFLRPLAGWLGDLRGRRLLVIGGAALSAVAIGAQVFAHTIGPLLLLRLLAGVGEAAFVTGSMATAVDLASPERRGEVLSYYSLALWGGIGVGPIVGEQVFKASGYTETWLVAGAIGVLAVLFAVRLPSFKPEVTPRLRLVHPKVLVPGMIFLASVWGLAGFMSFTVLHAVDVGISSSGLIIALYAGIILLVRTFGARIPDRVGDGRTASLSLLGSVAGLALLGLVPTAVGIVSGTVLFALGQSLGFPAMMSLALSRVPASERGVAVGTMMSFLDVAFGVGPITQGAVAEAAGYAGTYLFAGAIAALGFAGLQIIRRRARDLVPEVAAAG